MFDFLNDYIISESELNQLEENAHSMLQQKTKDQDRLRSVLQIMILAQCCHEALSACCTDDFVESLRQEIETKNESIPVFLSDKAREVREQLLSLTQRAESVQEEVNQRGKCILDVMDGIGEKPSEVTELYDSISEKMQQIELLLRDIVAIRQEKPFTELCSLIINK